ncbi:MAG: hypothetical protein PQJ58_17455 [Spirochaetales bacterium]|nr:hypothetical protein [Spirochaetales bacterium]
MHKKYYLISFALIFSLVSLYADKSSSWSLQKDQRSFDSTIRSSSYKMGDSINSHPALKIKEKHFYPPLQDSSLYFPLTRTKPSSVTLSTDQGIIRIVLPAAGGAGTARLIVPPDMTVQSMTLPLSQDFSRNPLSDISIESSADTSGYSEGGESRITLSLDSPEDYILSLGALEADGQELSIVLDNREAIGIVNGTGEKFTLQGFDGRRRFQFPLAADKHSQLVFTSPSGLDYLKFEAVDIPPFPTPLARSGEQILYRPLSEWRNRDFEVYSWSSFPEILIFDLLDYDVQNRFFRRLAFFVEKKGFKGQLLTNAELKGRHAWNAHDYRPSDLAEFFNLVEERNFTIYPEEALLRNLLIRQGILIQKKDGSLAPGTGAVLSISRESSDALRYRFFVHEASHGIYFTNFEYREFVRKLWESLDSRDREMWRFFLGWYGYDPEDEDLMINEFQAYLLQQRTAAAPGYFEPRMTSLAGRYPVQRPVLERGTGPGSAGFQVWAEVLEDWIFEKWGFKAGNFFPLHKELH